MLRVSSTRQVVAFLLTMLAFTPAVAADIRSRLESRGLQPYAERLTDAGRVALSGLCDLSEQRGEMPSLTDFRRAVEAPQRPLTQADYDLLVLLFAQVQSPRIASRELADLFRAYRRTIATYHVSYDFKLHEGDLHEDVHDHRELIIDGQKVLTTARRLDSPSRAATVRKTSFDGQVLRTYDGYADSPGIGGLKPLDNRMRFFREKNPLGMSMLLDSASDIGEEDAIQDLALAARTTTVNETPEEFAGVRCIVLGTPERFYYLDPEKGYAVRGGVEHRYYFNSAAGRLAERSRFGERRNGDFVSVEGIWLPKNLESIIRVDGDVFTSTTLALETIEINGIINTKVFSDLGIPDGTSMGDRIHNTVYEQGSDPSVQRAVQDAADRWGRGRRSRFLWIVGLNAVALGAIIYYVVLIRSRRRSS